MDRGTFPSVAGMAGLAQSTPKRRDTVSILPEARKHRLPASTVYRQGGSPEGHSLMCLASHYGVNHV